MENMKQKGARFKAGAVDVWMDCGNKNAMVDTNAKVLGFLKEDKGLVSPKAKLTGSFVISPCFIGENVTLVNSIVGPNVSIESGATITNSVVRNSIVRPSVQITDAIIDNSMLGERAIVTGKAMDLSLSDDSTVG
jgi:glucose-1-phosphate thymidylyltransferase